MNNKLFVGNLSFNTTENALHDAFSAHGTVLEANLMMDRMTGRPRGFGFITMDSAESAQKAIDSLGREQILGVVLNGVDYLPLDGYYGTPRDATKS